MTKELQLGGGETEILATEGPSLDDALREETKPETALVGALSSEDNAEILNELLQKSPMFAEYVKKRMEARALVRSRGLRARDWDIPFGPVSGPAGTVTTISIQPGALFRGEKIVATDTSDEPGKGTRILNVFVGSKAQLPLGGFLTETFKNNALGSGIKMDTVDPALSLSVTVSFMQSCTFMMDVFGKVAL